MLLRLLGALQVRGHQGELQVGGAITRRILAMLAVNANRPVLVEGLAAAAWDDEEPAMAQRQVQKQDRCSALRPHSPLGVS